MTNPAAPLHLPTLSRESLRWPARAALVALLLAISLVPAHSAELRIGTAQGNPGDTVDILLSLQGDGATVSANFLLERSWVARYADIPATVLAPGVSCQLDGSRFRATWDGSANTDLVDICIIRMTIHEGDNSLPMNPIVFGHSQECRDANNGPQECSIADGRIDVFYDYVRSFIVVLHDPPSAPTVQEVAGFDYADTNKTAPLSFADAVRPESVRAIGYHSLGVSPFSQWLMANPYSPITLLHNRGVRFTYASMEVRAQALALARRDTAIRDIVEDLGLAGPILTYPVRPLEHQPFGLFLIGAPCPHIMIPTPDSRTIEIIDNHITITLHTYPQTGCPGVMIPGYSAAIVEIPGLAAGTYSLSRAGSPWSIPIVVHAADHSITAPSIIPNPDVRLWLILGVLLLAAWRFQSLTR